MIVRCRVNNFATFENLSFNLAVKFIATKMQQTKCSVGRSSYAPPLSRPRLRRQALFRARVIARITGHATSELTIPDRRPRIALFRARSTLARAGSYSREGAFERRGIDTRRFQRRARPRPRRRRAVALARDERIFVSDDFFCLHFDGTKGQLARQRRVRERAGARGAARVRDEREERARGRRERRPRRRGRAELSNLGARPFAILPFGEATTQRQDVDSSVARSRVDLLARAADAFPSARDSSVRR